MWRLGRLPARGDVIPVEGWTVEVLDLDGRRASRLRVVPPEPEAPPVAVPAGPALTTSDEVGDLPADRRPAGGASRAGAGHR
jgi:hypothetical protein